MNYRYFLSSSQSGVPSGAICCQWRIWSIHCKKKRLNQILVIRHMYVLFNNWTEEIGFFQIIWIPTALSSLRSSMHLLIGPKCLPWLQSYGKNAINLAKYRSSENNEEAPQWTFKKPVWEHSYHTYVTYLDLITWQ